MGINLTNEQRAAIKNSPDTGDDSSMPYPSLGTHKFVISKADVKHGDYAEFLSLTIVCKCVDEPETRAMAITFRNDEKSVIDMGHFYARHALGKPYEDEPIEETDLLGVEIMGKVYQNPGKNREGETVLYTNLSKWTWVPSADAVKEVPKPAVEVKKEPPKAAVPTAKVPPKTKLPDPATKPAVAVTKEKVEEAKDPTALSDDELDDLLNS